MCLCVRVFLRASVSACENVRVCVCVCLLCGRERKKTEI